jgi:uncharacterized membrane protein (UPF0127 family)
MTCILSVWLLLLTLVACDKGEAIHPREATLRIETATANVSLDVEVADDDAERARGLMEREELGPIDGMAFVWDEPVETTFWMKDTLIPLSIAFWDDRGRIFSILDMAPCEAEPCPRYGPGAPILGALEVEQGAFADHGVEVGDHVELPAAAS